MKQGQKIATTYPTQGNPELTIINPTFKKIEKQVCSRKHAKMATYI